MKRGYGYRLSISVSNTDLPLVKWLGDATGLGSVHPMKRYKQKHKQAYRWDAWSMQASQILEAALPYLKQKRARAILAIKFVSMATYKGYLTDDEYLAQKSIYDIMRVLNKRGSDEADTCIVPCPMP